MKSWLPTAAFGIVVGAICAALIGVPQIRDLEQQFGLAWLFQLRGATEPPAEVTMVVMDQHASTNISLPRDPEKFHRCEDLVVGAAPSTHVSLPTMPSRWPRCLHAKLVNKLVDAGAAVIAFDVLFRERPPLPGTTGDLHAWQDETLASTLKLSGRAVIAQKIEIIAGRETLPVLSRSVEDAALGSAPFPLITSNGRRVDGFLAFKESGLVTPTLPVIAVQAYRSGVYPELTGLLARYAGADAELLPSSAQAFAAGGHLQTVALLIRELFRSDNTLADRVCGEPRSPDSPPANIPPSAELRALVSVYKGDGARLLNFYGPAGTIPSLSYDHVLAATPESIAPLVRGRAVFVGYAEASQQEQVEHFATAFSSDDKPDLSGVEVAATAFSNLLDDAAIHKSPVVYWLAAVFVAGALSFVFGSLLTNKVALSVTAVVLAIYGAVALSFFAHEIWIPIVLPILGAAPIGLFSAFSWKYWTAYRQREQLRRAFGYFVPKEVVNMLERNAAQVSNAHESLECACVSTDAANYTPLAESMTPEALTDFLNHYFEALFGGVAHHGGFVSDVVGDAMFAIWPHRSADTHSRLMRALLEMRDAAQQFNERLAGNQLRTRFGVDWGRVALTTVGAHAHYEYRAVGETPNNAQRIEELNKKLGTRVLLSSPAIGDAGDEFLLRDLGHFLMRGKTHSVHLYELVESRINAKPEQIDLCDRFASAMRAIQGNQRAEAIDVLHDILAAYPSDGPTNFFLRTLEAGISLQNGSLATD